MIEILAHGQAKLDELIHSLDEEEAEIKQEYIRMTAEIDQILELAPHV